MSDPALTDGDNEARSLRSASNEAFGVPRVLVPFYLAFMLDAIAVGVVMPVLPFIIMQQGANALQLSLVVSANYVAQTVGVIVMGRVSDLYGRRVVCLCCLVASTLSYIALSQSVSLRSIAASRIISGSFGGLLPVVQSAVADVAAPSDRAKYLGRITAVFGVGFVLGPALSASLSLFTTREKILFASLLPLTGFAVIWTMAAETKPSLAAGGSQRWPRTRPAATASITQANGQLLSDKISLSMVALVFNGFAIMYAFATETVYSVFIKDIFGFGEHSLSLLFVLNGMLIGVFQVCCIKPMLTALGDCVTLAVGDALLSLGMVGFALVRDRTLHFCFFSVHLVGFSMAETTIVELISRHSSPGHQGRNLAYNQAAQAVARVLGPLLAGLLYEVDKELVGGLPVMGALPWGTLPVGALPFLAGAVLPACAISVPLALLLREVSSKRKGDQLSLENALSDKEQSKL